MREYRDVTPEQGLRALELMTEERALAALMTLFRFVAYHLRHRHPARGCPARITIFDSSASAGGAPGTGPPLLVPSRPLPGATPERSA